MDTNSEPGGSPTKRYAPCVSPKNEGCLSEEETDDRSKEGGKSDASQESEEGEQVVGTAEWHTRGAISSNSTRAAERGHITVVAPGTDPLVLNGQQQKTKAVDQQPTPSGTRQGRASSSPPSAAALPQKPASYDLRRKSKNSQQSPQRHIASKPKVSKKNLPKRKAGHSLQKVEEKVDPAVNTYMGDIRRRLVEIVKVDPQRLTDSDSDFLFRMMRSQISHS